MKVVYKENIINILSNNKFNFIVNYLVVLIILVISIFIFNIAHYLRIVELNNLDSASLYFYVMDGDNALIEKYGLDKKDISTSELTSKFSLHYGDKSAYYANYNTFTFYSGQYFDFEEIAESEEFNLFVNLIDFYDISIEDNSIFLANIAADFLGVETGDVISISFEEFRGARFYFKVAHIYDFDEFNSTFDNMLFIANKSYVQTGMLENIYEYPVRVQRGNFRDLHRTYNSISKDNYLISDPLNFIEVGKLYTYCIIVLFGVVIALLLLLIMFELKMLDAVYANQIKRLIIIKISGGKIRDWLIALFFIVQVSFILLVCLSIFFVQLINNNVMQLFSFFNLELSLKMDYISYYLIFGLMQLTLGVVFVAYTRKINKTSVVDLIKDYSK